MLGVYTCTNTCGMTSTPSTDSPTTNVRRLRQRSRRSTFSKAWSWELKLSTSFKPQMVQALYPAQINDADWLLQPSQLKSVVGLSGL